MLKTRYFAKRLLLFCATLLLLQSCVVHPPPPPPPTPPPPKKPTFTEKLVAAALERTQHKIKYDGRYIKIPYPNGDVPKDIGVCTDVIVRSYRTLGIDLQKEVHEDMRKHFNLYPNLAKWELTAPDPNIDHRRVHNLRVFFQRHGEKLPVNGDPKNYKPGDLVTWRLNPMHEPTHAGHIGIVVDKKSKDDPNRHLIVHNIDRGPVLEDILFKFIITGHYRYPPQKKTKAHTQNNTLKPETKQVQE